MTEQVINVQQQIDELERRYLDTARAPYMPVWGHMDAGNLLRVRGLARFWSEEQAQKHGGEPVHFEQHMEDMITGWAGLELPLVFCLLGRSQGIEVFTGVQDPQAAQYVAPVLRGAFPGIQVDGRPVKLGTMLKDTSFFDHMGRMTGVPTRKAGLVTRQTQGGGERRGQVQQIERLVRDGIDAATAVEIDRRGIGKHDIVTGPRLDIDCNVALQDVVGAIQSGGDFAQVHYRSGIAFGNRPARTGKSNVQRGEIAVLAG